VTKSFNPMVGITAPRVGACAILCASGPKEIKMKRFAWLLLMAVFVLPLGCGSKDDGGAADGCGCGAAGDAMKDAGDSADKASKGAGDAMKGAGDAAKTAEITYTCACGKEKTLTAETPAPS
jgi:hypothetical protein